MAAMPRLSFWLHSFCVVLTLAAVNTYGQGRGAGLSQTSALERIGSDAFAQKKTMGMAFVVVHKGRVVFSRAYGSPTACRCAVTEDTKFAVGPITQGFTAASVLMLVSQGRLSLDDALSKYLPSIPNAGQITLRMLLNHRSGLHSYPNAQEHPWPTAGVIAPTLLMPFFEKDRPDFPPDARFSDSNTDYAMLAAVVAKVSGISYGDFLTQNLFRPLKMFRSGNGYWAQNGAADPFAGQQGHLQLVNNRVSLELMYGTGSVATTARDLSTWDRALMSNHFLPAEDREKLWTAPENNQGYAMGFLTRSADGHNELLQAGSVPGAGGYVLNAIFPDDQLAVIVLSNSAESLFRGVPEAMTAQVLTLFQGQSIDAGHGDPAQLARQFYQQITAGEIDPNLVSGQFNQAMDPVHLKQSQRLARGFGKIQTLHLVTSHRAGEGAGTGSVLEFRGQFEHGEHGITMFLLDQGRIDGYALEP